MSLGKWFFNILSGIRLRFEKPLDPRQRYFNTVARIVADHTIWSFQDITDETPVPVQLIPQISFHTGKQLAAQHGDTVGHIVDQLLLARARP